jgi:hypothetical protein
MVGHMTSTPLSYWKPGDEERRLRVFISHRHDRDEKLYGEVIEALNREGFAVQDMSLPASQVMRGPRGGKKPKLEIQAEIAARIYTSDVVIAPSSAGVSKSEWVTWEVQLASVGYGIPVLFINQKDQKYSTYLLSQVEDLGLDCASCKPLTHEIVSNIIRLAKGRPNWGMRQEEPDNLIRYRGPPVVARNEVLKKFPFQPRLSAPPEPIPPPKRSTWPKFW